MSNKMKYGLAPGSADPIWGSSLAKMYASVVLNHLSGRYVRYDSGDAGWILCANDEAKVGGYIMESGFTCNATTGITQLPVIRNVNECAFELPYAASGAAATLTQAVLDVLWDKIIDIYVTGNIQYADNATSQTIIRVRGGDVENNTLYTSVIDADIDQAS